MGSPTVARTRVAVTAGLADIGINGLEPELDNEDLDFTSNEHLEPVPMEAQA